MLKRRRATSAKKSRAANTAAGNEVVSYKPTPTDLKNFERISKFLTRAQASKTSHPKLLTKLSEMYKELSKEDFTRAFRACLRVPLTSKACEDAVKRIFLFVANFCAAINGSEESGDLCPFNAELFTHLLEGSAVAEMTNRLRSCQLINALLQSLDADKGLEIWLADAIEAAMLERMHDKSPQVRVQAVSALQRLQDPENPECPVISIFLDSMCHDPCADVRCRLVAVLARVKRTLPGIFQRHADEKHNVRKAAVLVLARMHMRSLKIVQRETLLNAALNDVSPDVRTCAETELLPRWLHNNDGDYFRFLGCLDVYTTGLQNVCKDALFALFKKAEVADLLAVANKVLVHKLLPVAELDGERGPQMLYFWCCLVAFLRQNRLEDDLDTILPNLTPFCVYVRQVMLGERLPKDADELDTWSFAGTQLVAMASGFDLADEMGRGELRRLLMDLLAANKSDLLVGPLVGLVELVVPAVQPRLIELAELVSDMHRPLAPAPAAQQVTEDEIRQLNSEKNKLRYELIKVTTEHEKALDGKDYVSAKTLDDELTAIKQRLTEINTRMLLPAEEETAVRREVTDEDTLRQCLLIIFEMTQDPKVGHLTPELRSLMQVFVEPLFQQPEMSEPMRLLCLRCFGAFCLLDHQVALEKIMLFYVPLAEEGNSVCAVASLQAIFDLYLCYGFAAFKVNDDIDERVEQRSRNSPGSKLSINILDSMLYALKDFTMPELVTVAATGFCKLLLAGRLRSYQVLIALVLTWFHQADQSTELRLVLSDFFSLYTSNQPDGLKLMVQCVVPLVHELLNSEEHEELEVSNVMNFVLAMIKTGINPNFKENVQLELAALLCDKIVAAPRDECSPYFAQALSRLDITGGTVELLAGLRESGLEVEELMAEDKLAKRFVTKYLANIAAAESLLATIEPSEADADEPADETLVEAAVNDPVDGPAPAVEAASPREDECAEEEDRMEIERTDSSKSLSEDNQLPTDVIAGSSSSPVTFWGSESRLVIPESDSQSSD